LPDADALIAAKAQAEQANGVLSPCGAPNDLPAPADELAEVRS
jgi:hypothetical protein